MYTRLLGPDQISLHKVWWLREASQIGQTFLPLHVCEKSPLKQNTAQHSRIPIDPAILAAIGHRFIAKKNPIF